MATAHVNATQVPSGSMTVLAVGPAPEAQVDKVTAHLKLL